MKDLNNIVSLLTNHTSTVCHKEKLYHFLPQKLDLENVVPRGMLVWCRKHIKSKNRHG